MQYSTTHMKTVHIYLHEDGLSVSTELPTGLLAVPGEQHLVGGDSAVGHPLLPSQHPDEHVWHAVLRLQDHGSP